MRIAFIVVSCDEPPSYLDHLTRQIKALKINNLSLYIVKNKKHKEGYAQGVNKGIRKGLRDGKDIFIVSNPDIVLSPGWEQEFLKASKKFDIWGFGFNQNGKKYYGGVIDDRRLTASLNTQKPKVRFQSSPFVSGSLICFKKKVVEKIGLWDEEYFLYYEEVDFCQRALKAGFQVGIDSKVSYQHFELSEKLNVRKKEYLDRSRWMFFMKYSNILQKLYELVRLPKTLTEGRPFVTNYLILNLSSFFNKLLNFVLFVFLVKYLSVREYGIYTLVWAHISLLQPFLDFGTTSYGLVHMSERSTLHLSSLFSLRIVLAIVVFIATLTLGWFGYNGEVFLFIIMTSFTLFSNALSGSLLIFSSLKEKLLLPSLLSMIFNVVLIAALTMSLIFKGGLSPLFVLTFFSYNLYTLINFLVLKKEVENLTFKVDFSHWFEILKKSIIFLFIGLFAGLYFKLDVFLLNFLKGTREVGIYSAGYKFLEAFLFLAASYNFISTPIMSKLKKEAIVNLKLKIKKDFKYLLIVGLGISSTVFFFSPIFLSFLFKGEYVLAIPVLKVVIWALPFILITSIFFNGLYVMGKAKIVMWLFIFQTFFNVVLNLIFIPKYSFMASSYITIIGELVNAAIASFFLYKTLTYENIS